MNHCFIHRICRLIRKNAGGKTRNTLFHLSQANEKIHTFVELTNG